MATATVPSTIIQGSNCSSTEAHETVTTKPPSRGAGARWWLMPSRVTASSQALAWRCP